ncbi:MAG: carboxylesterase family protein [Rhizobium sp.]
MRKLAPVLIALALTASAGTSHAEPAPVEVEGGAVQGTTQGKVDAWLGIPYAAPPVGKLRWEAPRPVKSWRRTLQADTYGPSCFQPDIEFVSEDCLTLNVFRPAGADGPLPVMVWIHGGAMVRGGANIYPLQVIAAQGVIGVSINYRLGRLGFFAHPALAREGEVRGNYGYLDQLAALKWVRNNIAAFGGDPANVTIFGESAGGGSVLAHLVSPMSKGFYERAILQSPGTPGGRSSEIPMSTLEEAEKSALDYAKLLGIDGTDEAAARDLRDLSPQTLVAGAGGPEVLGALARKTTVPGMAMAIIDGQFISETPEATFEAGRQNKVPLMLGANSRDLGLGVADTKEALFATFGSEAQAAAAAYDPDGTTALDELKVQVFADMTMMEPTAHLADLAATSGQPTWYYRFSYVPEVQRPTMPGTLHGMEIPYTLGVPQAIIGAANTAETDYDMASKTSGYWVNFGKTGDPNGEGLPEWKQHQAGSTELLDFTNDSIRWTNDPRAATLAIWKKVQDAR